MRLVEFIVNSIVTVKKELASTSEIDHALFMEQSQLYSRMWAMRIRFIVSECMYASACNQSSTNVMLLTHFLGLKFLDRSINDKHVYVTFSTHI
jgi:hypothetical protein